MNIPTLMPGTPPYPPLLSPSSLPSPSPFFSPPHLFPLTNTLAQKKIRQRTKRLRRPRPRPQQSKSVHVDAAAEAAADGSEEAAAGMYEEVGAGWGWCVERLNFGGWGGEWEGEIGWRGLKRYGMGRGIGVDVGREM